MGKGEILPACKIVTSKRGSKRQKSGEAAKLESIKRKHTKDCGF
jgi:hypothetical protein